MRWAFWIFFVSNMAYAYPDLIRHGYVNCNSCHASPSGGGMLTPYGRALSRELLSTWGGEREAEVFHGALPEGSLPEWLNVGGDVRGIQVHEETPEVRQGDFFLMQSRGDLGVTVGQVTGVLSVGEANPANDSVRFTSPQHYFLWNSSETLSVRAGLFRPNFGIPIAYHTLPTRQGLGFGPKSERHAVETMWSGEDWNLSGSMSRTTPDHTAADSRESLMTLQVNRNFLGTYRVGTSYLGGYTSSSDREAFSLHGMMGFTHRFAYLSEFTLQRVQPHSGPAKRGLYHFSQLIYEPVKGLQVYFMEDYQKTDLKSSQTLSNSFGPGLRFFPRPHFELDFIFMKQRVAAVADRYDDFAWLLTHYYF